MPKIFGTNLLGILAATVAFYIVGMLIYGILFSEQWMHLNDVTVEAAKARGESMGIMMYVWGFLITLMQVLGISYVLHQSSASRPLTCAKIAAILAVLIALPIMLYGWLYLGKNLHAIGFDLMHILIGNVVVGVVMSFFRGKDAIDPT